MNRVHALIATIVLVAALKLSRPVTLPLAAALCITILCWPLQAALERRLPRWLAFSLTFISTIATAAALASAVMWTVGRLLDHTPELTRRVDELVAAARDLALRKGILLNNAEKPPADGTLTTLLVERLVTEWRRAYTAVTSASLVLVFLAFMLLETRALQTRIREGLSPDTAAKLLGTASLVARQVRRHFGALTLSSGISGVLTGILAFSVGLELAVPWAIIVWLLNYIPTIGPALSVIPPTLYALVQFDHFTRPMVVFSGTAIIQFVMGNFIDPKIEGHLLSLSPLVVLVSVVFWGWLWGLAGAFLSVPLTAGLIVACGQFENTRWLATLTSDSTARRMSPARAEHVR